MVGRSITKAESETGGTTHSVLVENRNMKISHLQWPALVLAAVLGLESYAISSEPMAGNKVSGTTSTPKSKGEARGLLTSHFWGSEAPSSELPGLPVADQAIGQSAGVVEAAQPVFQPASWTNSLDNNIGNNIGNTNIGAIGT